MTLRHFQIFVTVCNTMNMTIAAETLFLSQSAVSQSIAEMERFYDLRLFERLSRKLYLTQAGEKLLLYARHMLSMNAEIQREMKTLQQHGTLRIGASVTIGAYVMPGLVAEFKSKYRDTNIEVVENDTQQIEQEILVDHLDFGIVEGETTSPDMVCVPYKDDELVLICSPTHRFAASQTVNPAELAKEAWIVREKGSGTRDTFEKVMGENNLIWNAIWTCNNADSIRMAVARGLGISMISKLAVEKEVAEGLLHAVTVRDLPFHRTFALIYHKNKYITVTMRQWMDSMLLQSAQKG